jgi:DNA-binding NtrC family response regulator
MINICIVDDEVEFLNVLEIHLSSLPVKFNLLKASNGKEALDIITSNKVDILITDMKMPSMEGNDLVATIYTKFEKHKPMCIFVISGLIQIDENKSDENFYFFTKPLDIKVFKEVILEKIKEASNV